MKREYFEIPLSLFTIIWAMISIALYDDITPDYKVIGHLLVVVLMLGLLVSSIRSLIRRTILEVMKGERS